MKKRTTAERFWLKVDKNGPFFGDFPCWVWTGSCSPNGYGQFSRQGAHRFAYELLVHSIGAGLQIHHRCSNKRCVNPYHLESIQPRRHVLISNGPAAINARRTHCVHGHEFTEENTVLYPQTPHKRYCRECQRRKATVQNAKKSARKKAALNGRSPYKNARKTHCPQGHPYAGDNLLISNGRRHCLQCGRSKARAYAKRMRHSGT